MPGPDTAGRSGRPASARCTLKNRIIKSATFEGASPRGVVTDELVDFHRRMAAGGVAMSTVAYLAVSPEGRTDRHCVLLDESSLAGLRRLTDAVHEAGAAVVGPDRSCRTGGQRPVQPGTGAGSDPPAQRQRGSDPGRHRGRHRPHHRGLPPRRRRWPSRPGSTASRSTWATTTC